MSESGKITKDQILAVRDMLREIAIPPAICVSCHRKFVMIGRTPMPKRFGSELIVCNDCQETVKG